MENSSEKQYPFFRFEDLRVYHKALDYIVWVNDVAKKCLENNNDQLLKRFDYSAQNIALNIAEGSARNKSQFIYHLKVSKTSLRECLVFTTIAYNLGYFSDELNDTSRGHLMEMTKMIGALISSLQKTMSKEEEEEDCSEKYPTNSYLT